MPRANHARRTAVWLLGCVLATPSLRAASLPSFEAGFRIMSGSQQLATNEVALTVNQNGVYRYVSHTWASGWISWILKYDLHELSQGVMVQAGIRPLRYEYRRTDPRGARSAELTFDWETSTVFNNVADSKWHMTIPPGTLDKLATQIGIMMELQKGTTEKPVSVADGGKLKQYTFRVLGTETVDLPAGRFDAVKISRLDVSADRPTYIWCAPELHYLPVRILQRNEDKSEYLRELEWFSESLRVEGTGERP